MKKNCPYKRLVAMVAVIILTTGKMSAQQGTYYYPEGEHAAVSLRTNALYDLALCPNVGLEIQTDLGLAFRADYIGAWWNSPTRNRYYSNYALQVGISYYVSKAFGKGFPYNGHHIGVYGQMVTFDFEFGGKGYMSRNLHDTWGIGMDYGYRLPISNRLSIDISVGIGYMRLNYLEYHPSGNVYIPDAYRQINYFGPTKAEASLVWNINKKNKRPKYNYFAL